MPEVRQQAKVMIVDDNADTRAATKVAIDAPDLLIIEAHSVTQAIYMALNDPPDLILLDMRLPDGDGLDVLHRLKSVPDTKDVPVICHTVSSRIKELQAAGEPFAGYVLKGSVGAAMLNDIVRAYIRWHQILWQ